MASASGAMGPIRRLFERLLHIRPEEFAIVQVFFLYVASIGMFWTFGNTVGDTLFLSRLDRAQVQRLLPFTYVGIAAGTFLVAFIYDWLQSRMPRLKLILAAQGLLALSLVAFRLAIASGSSAVLFGLVFWVDVCGNFCVMLLFSLAGDYFTSRDARRVFPYVLGGSPIGAIAAGWVTGPLVGLIGYDNLLYVCAGFLVSGAALGLWITTIGTPLSQQQDEGGSAVAAPLKEVLSPYTALAFAAILLVGAISSMTDYTLKMESGRSMRDEQLAVFFGSFYGWQGTAAGFIQFFLSGAILNRLGVIKCLMVLPGSVLVAGLGYCVHPSVMTAAAIHFARLTSMDTIYTPAKEMLFLPFSERVRVRAQTLAGGILSPVGSGVGGIILFVLTGPIGGSRVLPYALLALAALALAATVGLVPLYRKLLADSLKGRQLGAVDLERILGSEQGCLMAFGQLLGDKDPDVLATALGMLPDHALPPLRARVVELAASPHEAVAVGALRVLSRDRSPQSAEALRRALKDPRAVVAGEAAGALCSSLGGDAVPEVKAFLDSPDPVVRRRVLIGFARDGGFEGALLACPRINLLLRSREVEERCEGARILAGFGIKGVRKAVERLFFDRAPEVRRQALITARTLREPRLVARLLDQIGDLRLRPLAQEALEALPREAVPRIAESYFDQAPVAPDHAFLVRVLLPERCFLARVLCRIGGPDAARILSVLLGPAESLVVRVSAGHALKHLKKLEGLRPEQLAGLDPWRQSLVDDLRRLRGVVRGLGKGSAAAALLDDHERLTTELLLLALSLRFDIRQIRRIHLGLAAEDRAKRSNALELLDVSLPRDVAKTVVPLLSDEEDGRPLPAEEGLKILMDGGPWRQVLAHFHRSDGARDPRGPEGTPMAPPDPNMYRLVVTVSFLKKAGLFKDIPADFLTVLAEIAKEAELKPGEILFRQGDRGDALYIVCDGRVKVEAGDTEVASLGPGECVGEMAVLDDEKRVATVTAVEPTRLLRIEAEDFADILATQPRISDALLKTLTRRFRQVLERIPR